MTVRFRWVLHSSGKYSRNSHSARSFSKCDFLPFSKLPHLLSKGCTDQPYFFLVKYSLRVFASFSPHCFFSLKEDDWRKFRRIFLEIIMTKHLLSKKMDEAGELRYPVPTVTVTPSASAVTSQGTANLLSSPLKGESDVSNEVVASVLLDFHSQLFSQQAANSNLRRTVSSPSNTEFSLDSDRQGRKSYGGSWADRERSQNEPEKDPLHLSLSTTPKISRARSEALDNEQPKVNIAKNILPFASESSSFWMPHSGHTKDSGKSDLSLSRNPDLATLEGGMTFPRSSENGEWLPSLHAMHATSAPLSFPPMQAVFDNPFSNSGGNLLHQQIQHQQLQPQQQPHLQQQHQQQQHQQFQHQQTSYSNLFQSHSTFQQQHRRPYSAEFAPQPQAGSFAHLEAYGTRSSQDRSPSFSPTMSPPSQHLHPSSSSSSTGISPQFRQLGLPSSHTHLQPLSGMAPAYSNHASDGYLQVYSPPMPMEQNGFLTERRAYIDRPEVVNRGMRHSADSLDVLDPFRQGIHRSPSQTSFTTYGQSSAIAYRITPTDAFHLPRDVSNFGAASQMASAGQMIGSGRSERWLQCITSGCEEPGIEGSAHCLLHSITHCTTRGCRKKATPGSTKCSLHHNKRLCKVDGCQTSAQQGGRCVAHGGGKRCNAPGCVKSAQKDNMCAKHGGKRLCLVEGCKKYRAGKGHCVAHGGNGRCRKINCFKMDRGGGYCAEHSSDPKRVTDPKRERKRIGEAKRKRRREE